MSDVRHDGVRAMQMRGGTSKGLYFLAGDLPADEAERDDLGVDRRGIAVAPLDLNQRVLPRAGADNEDPKRLHYKSRTGTTPGRSVRQFDTAASTAWVDERLPTVIRAAPSG